MNRFIVLISAMMILCPVYSAGQSITRDQIKQIQETIRKRGLQWQAGENRLTRMSPDELSRYAPSIHQPPDWVLQWAMAKKAPHPPRPKGPLPASLDWRDRLGYNFITPVRDQGNCGSCWAFSTIATLEGIISWRSSDADPTLDLSEQHLFDCASLSSLGCDSGGVTWYTTGSFMSQTGVTSEQCYPYTSGQTGQKGTCIKVDEMTPECQESIIKTDDLIEITSTTPGWPWWDPPEYVMSKEAMDEIKTYLQDRPVGTSMRVYDDFYAYNGGIYEPTTTNGGGMHAVLIVGYNDDDEYWIIKNSWTEDFGEGGFFKIRYNTSSIGMFSFVYDYAEDHAAPAFCDDIPSSVELDGTQAVPSALLTLANCAGGILEWQAQMDESWLKLIDANGSQITSGTEVARAKTYSIESVGLVHDGDSGTITLTGAANGPVQILVTIVGEHEPEDAGIQDGESNDAGGDETVAEDAGEDGGDTGKDSGVDSGDTTNQHDDGTPGKDSPSDGSIKNDIGPDSGCGCHSHGALGAYWIGLLLELLLLLQMGKRRF